MTVVEFSAEALRRRLVADGRARLRVRGRSMWPLLRPGTVVEIRPVRPGEDLIGAVAVMSSRGVVVIHRVVDRDHDSWLTQGIASRRPDPPVAPGDVIGVVVAGDGIPLREGGLGRLAAAGQLAHAAGRAVFMFLRKSLVISRGWRGRT